MLTGELGDEELLELDDGVFNGFSCMVIPQSGLKIRSQTIGERLGESFFESKAFGGPGIRNAT